MAVEVQILDISVPGTCPHCEQQFDDLDIALINDEDQSVCVCEEGLEEFEGLTPEQQEETLEDWIAWIGEYPDEGEGYCS